MSYDDPTLPRDAGLQTVPFIREKLFAQEQAPKSYKGQVDQLVPFTIPLLVFSLVVADKLSSVTDMISPANSALLFTMCAIGTFIGIPIGCKAATSAPNALAIVFCVIAVPAAHIAAFNAAAWRIANWWEFGGSQAEFTNARFPVKSAVRGKSGTSLHIDPFGTREDTPLPTAFDPAEINAHPGKYCVTVKHRRSENGAVQIYRSGYYRPSLCSVSADGI